MHLLIPTPQPDYAVDNNDYLDLDFTVKGKHIMNLNLIIVPHLLLDPPRNAFPSFEPSESLYCLTLSLLPMNATAQVYTHTIKNVEVDSEGFLIIDRFRENEVRR